MAIMMAVKNIAMIYLITKGKTMSDFYSDAGFVPEIPKTVEGSQQEYHRFPSGAYTAFVGRLQFKFKDVNGKTVTHDVPGAKFSHGMLPLWVTKYSVNNDPKPIQLLKVTDKILIPEGKRVQELYHNIFISWVPADQWKNAAIFGSWQIGGDARTKVIIPSLDNPLKKITNFEMLPHYYGYYVKFNLLTSEKGNTYVGKDGIKVLNETKIHGDVLTAFESDIQKMVESERAERERERETRQTYVAPEAPQTDFDQMVEDEDTGLPF